MYIVLIAILDRERRRLRMSKKLLRGPPRASRASTFSPHTKLMMCGVHGLAPISRMVSRASILAMSAWSPGSKMGSLKP